MGKLKKLVSRRTEDLKVGLKSLDELENKSDSSSIDINEYIDSNGILDHEPDYCDDAAQKKKRCLFRTLGFVFFTAIITTTVVIIYPICFAPKYSDTTTTTASLSSSSSSARLNGSSNNTTSGTQLIMKSTMAGGFNATPARPDIHLLCTNTTTNDNYNLTNCRNACVSAACCYHIPAYANDCLVLSYDHCVGYMPYCDDFYLPDDTISPGGIVKRPRQNNNVTIKGAPPLPTQNLDNLCDKNKLAAEGPLVKKKCMDECLKGSCCMSGTLGLFAMTQPSLPNLGSCLEGHSDVCVKYKSCRNLEGYMGKAGTTGGSSTGPIIHQGIGNGIWNGHVANNNGSSSSSSSPDNGDTTTSEFLPIPHNISAICSPTNVKTTKGYSACDALCFPGQCCSSDYNIPGKNSCLFTHMEQCKNYAPCRILDDGGKNGNDDPTTACADLTTAKGRNNCRSACENASCCFSDGLYNCVTNVTKDWCGLYEVCKTLTKDTNIVPGGGGFVNIATGLPQTSQISVDSAKDSSSSTTTGATTGTTTSTNQKTNVPIPWKISSICSPSNIVTPDGFSDCDALCHPGQCCLEKKESKKNCQSDNEQRCQHYAPCRAMYTGGDPTTACADISSSDGRKQCEYVCGPAMCCFVTTAEQESSGGKTTSCKTELTEDWCQAFEVCRRLTTTTTTTTTTMTGRGETQEEMRQIEEGLRGWKSIMSNVPVTTMNMVDDNVVSSSSIGWMTAIEHLIAQP